MTDTENLPPRRNTRLRSGATTTTTTTTPNNPPSIDSKNQSVSPLRIAKNASKAKTLSTTGDDTSLRDISPGSCRRNSPSTFQIKEKTAALHTSVGKPLPTSPPSATAKSEGTSSVRSFWQNGAGNEGYTDHKRKLSKSEGGDLKSLRSSYVKNNIFLAKDMKERESSPKLTMSPSQHRLSTNLGEVTPTASPTRAPAPVDVLQSPQTDTWPTANATAPDATPKASCLHSTRIKGPRQNTSDTDSPSPAMGRRERRKTVTFDEAPQVLQFDRRSSHETTSSEHSSATNDSEDSKREPSAETTEVNDVRPLPSVPSRPLPQVPPHDSEDDRPSSKDSSESDYGEMEARIRSMMERAVLQDLLEPKKEEFDQEDIFSLYTTTNEMEDDEPLSQESVAVFSSQETSSTALSSQVNSQDEELERQLSLQKQSEELLKAVKSRPFSLAELPALGFSDEAEEEPGAGLGLSEFCTPESVDIPQPPPNPPRQAEAPAITEEPPPEEPIANQDAGIVTPPVTPPESSDLVPQAPVDQTLPPEALPSTPPSSPQKQLSTEDDATLSPIVPEREATIRSRGGSKLRVRPSLSRQEAESILARRRKSELPPLPNLNDIREQSVEPEVKVKIEEDDNLSEFGGKFTSHAVVNKVDLPLLKIEGLGFENDGGNDNGFGARAVEEMERVIEAQKVCYFPL